MLVSWDMHCAPGTCPYLQAEDEIMRGCLLFNNSSSGRGSTGQMAVTQSKISSSAEVMRPYVDTNVCAPSVCTHLATRQVHQQQRACRRSLFS